MSYLMKGWRSMTTAAKIFFVLLLVILSSSAISELTNNKETENSANQVPPDQEINPEAYIKKNGYQKMNPSSEYTSYSVTERISRANLATKEALIRNLPKSEKVHSFCNFFANLSQTEMAKKGPGIEVSVSDYAFVKSSNASVCVYKYKQFNTVGTQIVYMNGNKDAIYSYIITE